MYRGVLMGLGGIARSGHIPAFLHNHEVASRLQIVGIVDSGVISPGFFQGIPLLPSPDGLADLGKIDFVDICTPTASHLAMSLWGLSQGYHVLCEKPVAVCLCNEACLWSSAKARHRSNPARGHRRPQLLSSSGSCARELRAIQAPA